MSRADGKKRGGASADSVTSALAHTLVDASGHEHRRLRVFCRRAGHSVDQDVCLRCPAFVEVVEPAATGPTVVRCVADGERDTGELATALGQTTLVCVRPDVPVAELGGIFARYGAPFLLVLDVDRPVGLVWPTTLAHAPRLATCAKDVMTTVHLATENASLADALHEMARGHLRWLPVMACDGAPIGALRDVEALRAWATGARSAPSCEGAPTRARHKR